MAIPDYQTIMLPLLKFLADNEEHSKHDAVEHLKKVFGLTGEEERLTLPSGKQAVIDNRIGWSRTYLKNAGLIESTRRGFFKITPRGLDVLKENPPVINNNFLQRFPEFLEFRELRKDKVETQPPGENDEMTPQESLEYSYQKIREELARDLLARVKTSTPDFFENLVVELLVKIGYGGTIKDAGRAIGRSGDGGVDGVIYEDRLGLDKIYIQAKRWDENTVGRPKVQEFAGALAGKRARKGVFITTSKFSKEAHDFVSSIDSKIILVDGVGLTNLMIDYGVGVSTVSVYEIKKIDSDYFGED